MCKNVVFLICGYDPAQMNDTMMATIASHIPAGTSAFTIVHYGQEYNYREMEHLTLNEAAYRWFLEDYYFGGMDWGSKADNMAHHGTEEPPIYNPNNINTKVRIVSIIYIYMNDNTFSLPFSMATMTGWQKSMTWVGCTSSSKMSWSITR